MKSRTISQTGTAVRPAWGSASAAIGIDRCGSGFILRARSWARHWWRRIPGPQAHWSNLAFRPGPGWTVARQIGSVLVWLQSWVVWGFILRARSWARHWWRRILGPQAHCSNLAFRPGPGWTVAR